MDVRAFFLNHTNVREYVAELAMSQDIIDSSRCYVSIVIPTYNCEDYIVKCLDSLYRQGLEGEFEVIVVDDCSTDSTRQIVSTYSRSKPNVTLLKHSENKKQGAARNTGIRSAKGEYIFFLDGDDWLGDGGLAHMLDIASAKSADVVACGIQRVYSDGRTADYHAWSFESYDLESNVRLFSDCKIGSPAANKLYRRQFLLENDILFIEPYYHEDILFTAHVTFYCRRYVSIAENYYNYFWNESSTLNCPPTKLHLLSYFHLLSEMGKYTDKVQEIVQGDITIINNLTRNYGTAEILPKLKKYLDHHGREALESGIFECASKMFGGHGYYLASIMLKAIPEPKSPPLTLTQRVRNRLGRVIKGARKRVGQLAAGSQG